MSKEVKGQLTFTNENRFFPEIIRNDFNRNRLLKKQNYVAWISLYLLSKINVICMFSLAAFKRWGWDVNVETQIDHFCRKDWREILMSNRAVARPWRERQLPRAPVYRERKNSQIFFENLKIQEKTNFKSQKVKKLLLLSLM